MDRSSRTSSWNIADGLREQASTRGEHCALHFDGEPVSYRELDRRSNRVAQAILASGLPRQSRVAVLDHNSERYLEILFGAAKAGCVLVGINSRLAAPEVRFILDDSATRILFVGPEHLDCVAQLAAVLHPELRIIALQDAAAAWQSYGDWLSGAPGDDDPRLPCAAEDDAVQLYTSGTTGTPKGVCHTHGCWRAFADVATKLWATYSPEAVNLVSAPLFHVAGYNPVVLAVLHGATTVLLRKADPGDILEAIARHRVTHAFLVPAVIAAVVRHPRAGALDLRSLRSVAYGAAPMPESLLEESRRILRCEFIQLYGLTENLGGATALPASMHDTAKGKLRSVGTPYPGVSIRIVDANGNELPCGTVGEVILRCEWLMRAYWQRPDATADAIREGWLYTGDAGFVDADGYLFLHDRIKDMIVSGGENVYPAEVESALFAHPSIADAAVIGVPDDRWGEAVKAVVVLKPDAPFDPAEVTRFLRTRIAGYKLPRSFDVITQLPRNASGKVLRRELREKYWAGKSRRIN